MEIYKILVIGNSFGEDATHFLHDLALTSRDQYKGMLICISEVAVWNVIGEILKMRRRIMNYQLNGRAYGKQGVYSGCTRRRKMGLYCHTAV